MPSPSSILRQPIHLAPGATPTLWNNDAGFKRTYLDVYPGYYSTADAGYKDADGYLLFFGRPQEGGT